jgi:hypothetical protein
MKAYLNHKFDEKGKNNWLVHGILVKSLTEIPEFEFPECEHVNVLYYVHDSNCDNIRIVYCLVGKKPSSLSVRLKKRKREKDEKPEEKSEVIDLEDRVSPIPIKSKMLRSPVVIPGSPEMTSDSSPLRNNSRMTSTPK